jgi:hypothetical protein
MVSSPAPDSASLGISVCLRSWKRAGTFAARDDWDGWAAVGNTPAADGDCDSDQDLCILRLRARNAARGFFGRLFWDVQADLLKCLLEGARIHAVLQDEFIAMIAPYVSLAVPEP